MPCAAIAPWPLPVAMALHLPLLPDQAAALPTPAPPPRGGGGASRGARTEAPPCDARPSGAVVAPPALARWDDALPLDHLLGRCRRQGRLAALLLVELQPANPDTAAALLQAVGQRLRGRVRAHDEVALTADGALAALLRDAGEQTALLVRSRLEGLLRSPYRVHADLVQPLLRIGHAVAGLDGRRGAELLRAPALPAGDRRR